MAEALTPTQIRQVLGSPGLVRERAFDVLKAISGLVNSPGSIATGREMILRALERRPEFGATAELLDALVRTVGLFPYVEVDALGVRDRIAYEFHRPLNMPDELVFHQQQAEVYARLLSGENVILSAPTSFGKSRIIDAMIASARFENIAVIVPTLALIDETRRRLSVFSDRYKVVTHLSQAPSKRNIFVLTAERAVAYAHLPKIDFFVIDEFYKIGALDEDESRTVALNQAFYRLQKGGGQFYLLGPNIERIPAGVEDAFKCTFYSTTYATVVAEQYPVRRPGTEIEQLVSLAKELTEPTLVFCSSPGRVNTVANELLRAGVAVDKPAMKGAAEWSATNYHPDWIFPRALQGGIGIHHGRLPRALAQYVVRMFNEGQLDFLICTSTLIEGVNTKAKNVVIFDNTIAKKQIDYFTFNNIKGRSGRMFQHFVGRVYVFDDPPDANLPFVDFPLLTQGQSTPDSLLIQLDKEDLSDTSQARIARFADESVLPMDIIRQNNSIDPQAQINLARAISGSASRSWPYLAWRAFPKYNQLKYVCELIWEHLVDASRRSGVFSGSQLAHKTWQLWQTKNSSHRVLDELKPGKFAAKSADEAVERVLQFERNWAGFDLPRYLMAVSRIQGYLLPRLRLSAGDYSSFSSQVESMFRTPVVAALDEYGVPLQVAEKLQAYLRTTDDLDGALAVLKRLDLSKTKLTAFERDIVSDAQKAI